MSDLAFIESRCAEMTAGDWKALDRWLQQQPIDAAKAAIEALPGAPDLHKIIMQEAAQRALRMAHNTFEGQVALESIVGAAQWLYLSMRKADPNLKPDDAYALVTADNFRAITKMLDRVHKINQPVPDTGQAPDPTTGAASATP